MFIVYFLSILLTGSLAFSEESPSNCKDAQSSPVPSLALDLARQGRDLACQSQCKQFWMDHPEAQPTADEHPYCRSGAEFLKSIPRTIGPKCWTGLKDGFSVTQHLKGYALFVKDIGAAIQKQLAEHKEFFESAQKDPEFRLGLVRMLSQYSGRNPDGSYQVADKDLPPNLVNGDLVMLTLMLQKDLSSRERSCSVQVAQLTKTWENSGLDGNALATKRYQTIASRAPECIGTLGIPIPADSNGAPDPAASTMQCLSVEKIEQSICAQAASFASDPLTLLPAGMLVAKSFRLLKQLPEATITTRNLLKPTIEVSDKFKTANTVAKLFATPYKPLAQNASKTINVVGSNFSSKEVGATIAGKLDEFNQSARAMGFKTPGKTRVIIEDKPLLPSITGPYTVNSRVLNVRDLSLPDNTIVMKPIGYRTAITKSSTAVFHEQTHSILHVNYKPTAYVNKDATVQEALSDFLSGHHAKSPIIGENGLKNSPGLRDMRTQREYYKGGSSDVITRETLTAKNEHTNSIPFSNLLWQVRSAVGEEKMSALIKPIIDDLNRNYASAGITASQVGVKAEQANFQYFAASLRKTLTENGVDVPSISKMDIKNRETMSLFYLNQKDTVSLSSRLTPAGNFERSAADAVDSTLLIHASAGAAATIEGSLLYTAGKYSTSD